MNIFVPIFFFVSLVLAEPPVGDGYPEARSFHDHHHDDDHGDHHDRQTSEHQRSLSQAYGPPSFGSRNAISEEYNAPNTRSGQNAGRQSQKYAPPSVRISFNQRFGSRSSPQGHSSSTKGLSQDYAAPNARSEISQEYGLPASRSLSQEYGVPAGVSARTPSTEYGKPDSRSTQPQEYGVPVLAARSNQPFSNLPVKASQDYSAPAARSQSQNPQSRGYASPSARSNDVAQSYAPEPFSKSAFSSQSPSQSYGVPKGAPSSSYGAPSSRSLSTSYEASSARNSDSYSQDHNTVSQTYGVPNQRDLSETYDAPNARSLSQEYGVPSSRTNLKTDAVASSYAPPSSRSAPSSSYLPAARDATPSQQYGVPDQDNKGYEDARARALEELLNQEPANYDFAYQIEDQESGSDFGHTETRHENRATGSYFVVLPDGTKQTVEYEADERGFQPRISVEPAAGGYDENAADIASARAAAGPY